MPNVDTVVASMKEKAGPIPVWGWVVGISALGYLVMKRKKTMTASTSPQLTGANQTNSGTIDPTSGLTYGQEANGYSGALLNAQYADLNALGLNTSALGSLTSGIGDNTAAITGQPVVGGAGDPYNLLSNFKSFVVNYDAPGGGGIFGVTNDGKYVHLTGNEWAALASQGAKASTTIGKPGDPTPPGPPPPPRYTKAIPLSSPTANPTTASQAAANA